MVNNSVGPFGSNGPLTIGLAALALVSSSVVIYRQYPALTRSSIKQHKKLFSSQTPISNDSVALDHLLAAFGPDGRNAPGTAAGCMVASPSKEGDGDSNNYWFQWPRDSGCCVRSLLDLMKSVEEGKDAGAYSASDIERRVKDFFTMSLKLQHTPNQSGTFETGGLGEPKFNVDGTAFEGSWGRPQNDGPALRSIVAAKYLQHLLKTRDAGDASTKFAKQHLWGVGAGADRSLIKADLDYISRAWKGETFELWEEVNAANGGHFHVLMTQRRALLEGVKLAKDKTLEKDDGAAERWSKAADAITKRLEDFWNKDGALDIEGGSKEGDNVKWDDERNLSLIPKEILSSAHVVPTRDRVSGQPKPTQADTAVLLGFTHAWDGDVGKKEDDTWEPWSERCLATLNRNIEVFAAVYPVNKGRKPEEGVLCGRYPEDVYDGVGQSIGNPWFLTTFAVSNVLYLFIAHHATTSLPISISPLTHALFKKAYPSLPSNQTATYHRGSQEWELILKGLRSMADRFVENAARYADDTGRMSEQIDRFDGHMRGARELSWSFASLLAVHYARQLVV